MRKFSLFAPGRALCAAAVCLLAPSVLRATTIASNTPVVTATAGTTGMFEEFLTNSANFTGEVVTGFSLTLTATATAATGLSFTAATMATTPDAYIFQGASTDAKNGVALSPTTFPNLSFTAADTDTSTAGVTLVGGVNYALVEVAYAVAANATPGVYTLTNSFTLTGSGSLGVATTPGTFTILAPEPSIGAMLLAGGGLVAGTAALRRRAAR